MKIPSSARKYWVDTLDSKLPEGCAPEIARWIVELDVTFVISRPRKTKLGDFRVDRRKNSYRISVNENLNPYSFLVTTIHEFAHLGCYLKHGHSVMPHGEEWKRLYVRLLHPFVESGVFPSDLTSALQRHLKNPKASSCTCPELSVALDRYDESKGEPLASLQPGSTFEFGHRAYRFIELRRTRVLCERLADGKRYLISKRAKVVSLA